MSKIAFMFSGQGAQYLNMGRDIYDKYDVAKEIFNKADTALGFSISDIIFNDEVKLNETKYTQPAIFSVSVALLKVLEENNIKSDYVCGLSLGEYSALYASGVLSFENGVNLVHRRGNYMSSVVKPGVGAMAAIIGMDADILNKICESQDGICEIANYNCPNQLVIGGEMKAVENACEVAKEKGARRAIMLNVSGPFHTSLLKEAGELLKKDLEDVKLEKHNIDIVMNTTGELLTNENVKDLMVKQVSSSVLFEKSIRTLINEGVDTFIEIGPGRVLSGFVKKIDRSLKTLNVENIESLEKTINNLRGE